RGERRPLAEDQQRSEEREDEHDGPEPPLLADPHERPELSDEGYYAAACHARFLSSLGLTAWLEGCQAWNAPTRAGYGVTQLRATAPLGAIAFNAARGRCTAAWTRPRRSGFPGTAPTRDKRATHLRGQSQRRGR